MKYRIHLIQSAVLFGALAIGLGILGPLRSEAKRRAEIIKNQLIAQLESDLDIDIRFSAISPSLLSAVTISGVEIKFPLGVFTASKFRIFYNPLKQFAKGGRGNLTEWITRIAVHNGHLITEFDGNRDASSKDFDSSAYWNLLRGKTLVLDNFSSETRLENLGTVRTSRVELLLSDEGKAVRYRFSGDIHSQQVASLTALGPVAGKFRSSGSFALGESSFNGRLDIDGISSDIFNVKPMSADLIYSQGELTLLRIDDELPMDLKLHATNEHISITGIMVDIAMSHIIQASSGQSSWLDTRLNGSFDIGINRLDSAIIYNINMDADIPQDTVLPWHSTINLDISGTQESALVRTLRMKLPWGYLDYKGNFHPRELTPEGILSFVSVDSLSPYPIDASFRLHSLDDLIMGDPIRVEAAGISFYDVRFFLTRDIDLLSLSLQLIADQPDGTPKRILIDALLDTQSEPSVYGFVRSENFETSHLMRLAGIPLLSSTGFARDSFLDMNGIFKANADSWTFSIENAQLTSLWDSNNTITLKSRISSQQWSVDVFRVVWNDYVFDGRISSLTTDQGGKAQGRIIFDDKLYPINASWDERGLIELVSDFGLSARLGSKTSRGRSLNLLGDGISVSLKNGRLDANFDIRGEVGKKDWQVSIRESIIGLTHNNGAYSSNTSFTGTLVPGKIELSKLRFTDSSGILDGNALFQASSINGDLSGHLTLESLDNEQYNVLAIRSDNQWDVNLEVQNGSLQRFDNNLGGRINLQGQLSGDLNDPVLKLHAETREGLMGARPFEFTGSATLDAGNLSVKDIIYVRDGVSLSRGLAFIDLNKGRLRATAELAANYNQIPVSTGMSLALDFNSGTSFLNVKSLMKENFTGTLATQPVLWDKRSHLPNFTFQFVRNQKEFRIRTPDKTVLDFRYQYDDGTIEMVFGDPMPIRALAQGIIKDGRIDVSFPTLSVDPVLINYIMVRDPILLQYHVVFQDGRLIGNLDINGPTESPDIYGTIDVIDLKVDTPYTYADIRPASTKVHFEGNRINFDRIDIPVGDGFVFGEGYMVLDSWKMTDFNLITGTSATSDGGGVPLSYPLFGVYLDGLARSEIHIRGSNKEFVVDGDIRFPFLKASLGSPRIPVVQRPDKRKKPLFLDLNIYTGNNCTFYLPNEQLKIVRATAEPDQALHLIYQTIPKSLSLSGVLPVKSGSIYYFDRDFQIVDGSMLFNETLDNFDPIIQLRAETRVRDESGDEVGVALVYDAPIKSDFNPSIETSSASSNSDVLSLFGQAFLPYEDSEDSNVTSVLLATGGVFAQMGLVQPFEDILREGLNLDMVTIRTDIIANALAESLNTNGTSGAVSGLGRYLDNTRLFAGKYIGNSLFVSGSVSARYFESQRLSSLFGGLEFETAVSLEMTTPFFNIAWSYTPNPLVYQNFIAGNSISLKWQFSY